MVIVTTFVAPPLLAVLARRGGPGASRWADKTRHPGDGGIGALVFGERDGSPSDGPPGAVLTDTL